MRVCSFYFFYILSFLSFFFLYLCLSLLSVHRLSSFLCLIRYTHFRFFVLIYFMLCEIP